MSWIFFENSEWTLPNLDPGLEFTLPESPPVTGCFE